MRRLAFPIVVGLCVSCGSRAALHGDSGLSNADLGLSTPKETMGIDSSTSGTSDGEADGLPTFEAGDATYAFDVPAPHDAPLSSYDSMPERRMGGTGNLNDGGACSQDRYWLFPDEGFSSFCGDVGEACSFVCGDPSGCREATTNGGPQLLYCPSHGG